MTAGVEAPLVIEDPDAVDWFDAADVVVVGFGGAGAATALQARADGASVIAVDRFSGGGATERSGGVVYAGGTRHQRDAGVEDDAEEMFRYLKGEGMPVRDDTLRRFCETSSDNLDWLASHGVRFGSSLYSGRVTYPPEGYFLYYTGMEKFRSWARPAPRGHRAVGRGPTGRFYFAPLKQSALRHGVKLIEHAPARRLVMDGDGRVIGIDVQVLPEALHGRHDALFRKVDPYRPLNALVAERAIGRCRRLEQAAPRVRRLIRARRGVVLATGSYTYNLGMVGRHRPAIAAAHRLLVRGDTMGSDGSGIELAVSAGGDVSRMGQLVITKSISPPEPFLRGVLVNAEGRRFVAEDAHLATVGEAVAEQSRDGAAWLILDSETFWDGMRRAAWPPRKLADVWTLMAVTNVLLGGTRRGSSPAALARRLGIDAAGLERTVAGYNAAAGAGKDPLGKQPANLVPLRSGAWYAVNLSLRNRWGFSGFMATGGVTVDEETGAVVRRNGSAVAGLFAAGRTAVGIPSGRYFSGLSLADTVFSGRRAAAAAVARFAAPQVAGER